MHNQLLQEAEFLSELFQLRDDWLGFEEFQSITPETLRLLLELDTFGEEKLMLIQTISKLELSELILNRNAITKRGVKGLIGSHPIHAALLTIARRSLGSAQRLRLFSYIVGAARLWRESTASREGLDNSEPRGSNRPDYERYTTSLSNACLAIRKLSEETIKTLDFNASSINEFHARISIRINKVTTFYFQREHSYLQNIERFLAYSIQVKEPRLLNTKKKKGSEVPPLNMPLRSIDTDPDDDTTVPFSVQMRFIDTIEQGMPGRVTSEEIRAYGLARSEDASHLVIHKESAPLKRNDTVYQSIARSRAANLSVKKAAQLLPHRSEQLNNHDLRQLWSRLDVKPEGETLRLIFCLMLMTGRSIDDVLECHLVRSVYQLPRSLSRQSLYLCCSENVWISSVLTPEDRRQFQPEWAPHMHASIDRIFFPIPADFHADLAKSCLDIERRAKQRSVALFTQAEKDRIKVECKKYIQRLNRHEGTRTTLHRLGNQLFNTLNNQDGDIADACLITGKLPPFGHQASLYYYAPAIAHLTSRYTKAITSISSQLGIENLEDTHREATPQPYEQRVGSQLVPREAYLKRMVNELRKPLQGYASVWRGADSFIDFHNHYTCYTLMLLLFSTGYRCVRDPISRASDINLQRQTLLVTDKIEDSGHHTRVVPLAPLFLRQLDYYQAHCQFVKPRLDVYLQRDWKTVFFFIDRHMRPLEASPQRLASHLVWEDSPPLNINRHHLRTKLRELEVPGEYVDAFMGHWDNGQEPFGRFSTFDPVLFRLFVADAIEQLLREQGWQAIKGLE